MMHGLSFRIHPHYNALLLIPAFTVTLRSTSIY